MTPLFKQGFHHLGIGNDSIGFFPLFEPNAENGLGSDSPPETLFLNRRADEIFNFAGFDGFSSGTTLRYRIFDNPKTDNFGGFTVANIPEPSSTVVTALLFGLANLRLTRTK